MLECKGCRVKEKWRKHPYISNLWISNLGGAYLEARLAIVPINRWGGYHETRLSAKYLKLTSTSKGYIVINIRRKQYRINVLMLECFVGPRPKFNWHACHRDDIPWHNCLKNLRWDSPKGNRQDVLIRNGQGRMFGKTNPLTVIPTKIVKEIKELRKNYRLKYIANKFGISMAQVSRISCGISRTKG